MRRKTSKIKITIVDKKDNVNIRLPGIPFWLISSLSSFAFIFKPFILKSIELDEDAEMLIGQIDSSFIRDIIRELRSCGPFNLVDISTGDGTKVEISIL